MRILLPAVAIVTGAILIAIGFNFFLIPHELLSGGVSGVSMIIGYITGWDIALLYFIINVPILVWGWLQIGRWFVVWSIVSVIATSWFIELFPVKTLVSDPLIGSVFGGVLVGIGSGVSLRAGGSTGGFDIVGSILTRKRDFPLGTLLLALNGIVIFLLGYIKNWDLALSSLVSVYVTSKVVDTIHVRHIKITAFIITNHAEAVIRKLLQIPRGVTVIKTQGAYTHTERDMLMTVATRYELAMLKKLIREADPAAFVNIVETVEVMGEFRRNR